MMLSLSDDAAIPSNKRHDKNKYLSRQTANESMVKQLFNDGKITVFVLYLNILRATLYMLYVRAKI